MNSKTIIVFREFILKDTPVCSLSLCRSALLLKCSHYAKSNTTIYISREKKRKPFQICWGLAKEEKLSVWKGGTLCAYLFWYTVAASWPSRVWLFVTPWTVAHQAPPSMGFPRQEYWSGLPFPSPGNLPDPGIEHNSPALAGGSFTAESPGKTYSCISEI